MEQTTADLDSEAPYPVPRMIRQRVVADALYHQVSRELLAARVCAGLFQKHIAAKMGTTTSALSRLENATGHRPTLTTLEHYAQAVDCDLEIRLVPCMDKLLARY